MARFSLWTPLIVILIIQLSILVFLNLKTLAPTNAKLLTVHISAADPAFSAQKTRGSLLNIQTILQIGAPANGLNDERRNGNKSMPVIDKNLQIDVPGENVDRAEQRVGISDGAAVDPVVEREKKPSDKERRVGVGEDKGDAVIKRGDQNAAMSVNRNELRKRSDDEQLTLGEREKAHARGERKGQPQQLQGEMIGASLSKWAQNGTHKRKEELLKDGDKKLVVDRKADYAHESVPNISRRKVNQVSMLKSHGPDRPVVVRDQNKKPSVSEEMRKHIALKKDQSKVSFTDDKKRAHIAIKQDQLPRDDIKKNSIQSNSAVKSEGNHTIKKVAGNSTNNNKRPLIEKVGQLKMKKAGFGRLKDMPFMKARRFIQQEKNKAGDLKPPKFNQKQIMDLLKYSDRLNYFEEFCKEVSEPLVECGERTARELTEAEKAGETIMFTLRTTLDYHDQRLPVLFETWLSTVDPRTVFLVTDGEDAELDEITENIGMHYINAQSGTSHSRIALCCKAGVELELMFYQQNEVFDWLCHVDDDMYVNLDALVNTLAKFQPKEEPIYFGRSGSLYLTPRTVKNVSKLGTPNTSYHFAVGGMYCLSRRMLELAKDYLVGCEAFSESCKKTLEPEDVTVGLVIGAVLHQELSRTEMIYSHGLDLMTTVPAPYVHEQEPCSVPMKTSHKKKRELAAVLEEIKNPVKGGKLRCVCTWKTPMCCELWKEAYRKSAEHIMKERMKQKEKEKAAKEAKVVGEVQLANDGR